MTAATATLTTSPLWFLTRSTGVAAFVVMTVSTTLGIAATQRVLMSPRWPRFATQTLHRNAALLGMVLLAVHVATTMLDSYVDVGWWSTVVPGISSYRTLWVGFGTLALDALLAVTVTSMLRLRLPHRVWRLIHWSSYAAWPAALVHFLGTGTDAARGRWGLWLALACVVPVGAAVVVRLTSTNSPRPSVAVRRSA